MDQTVTVKIKIKDNSNVLDDTLRTFSSAVQTCIDYGWEFRVGSKRELHDLCYYKIKKWYNLQSQLVCNAISQAFEMLKRSNRKPVIKKPAIRYNFPRCASIKEDWKKLSISTIKSRRKFDINVPKYFEKYLNWKVCESTLIKKNGMFFFCFTFSKEVSIKVNCDGKVLGVDLGVNKLAVTSDNRFFGKEFKKLRNQRDELVAELQSKGTSASRNRLKSFGSRWKQFMTWLNHNISKEIISKLSEGDVVVMENLTYIRKNTKYNHWVQKWAFRQLQFFIEYKATLKGIKVVKINPKNTSKQCSRCGSLHTSRHCGFFECLHCGFSLDADLNASRNMAQRYKRNTGLRVDRKPAHDLTHDDVEATCRTETKCSQKPLP